MPSLQRAARRSRINPLARTIGSISALLILVSGVTFAALQSQESSIEGNRITSATASLYVGDREGSFATRRGGFDFTEVVPGGDPSPVAGKTFNLLNQGTTDLKLFAKIDPAKVYRPGGTDMSKVSFVIKDLNQNQVREVTLGALMNAAYAAQPYDLDLSIRSGVNLPYTLQVKVAGDAIGSNQEQLVLMGVDLIFSGEMVQAS